MQLQIAKILESIYEPLFRESSYGFRPKRSCHTAVKALFTYLSKQRNEIEIDIDLENFFGRIKHQILIEFLRRKIKDERFIRYVARMLKSGILSEGQFRVNTEGSAQGNIASPILSNIYAHYVIDEWMEDTVPRYTIGVVKSFRYADDLVICCQDKRDAEKIQRSLKKRLNKYGLEMNQEKTKTVKFNQRAYPKIKQGQFDYLGFTFYIKLTRKGRCHIAVKTAKKRFRAKLRNVKTWCQRNRHRYKLKTLWLLFNAKLRGHIQYYAVSLNTAEVSNFVVKATRIFFKWINRRSQKKSITWEKFELFCKAFPRVKVRVQHRLY